jgi:16S rRNA U1498 N3-methylase RsmE
MQFIGPIFLQSTVVVQTLHSILQKRSTKKQLRQKVKVIITCATQCESIVINVFARFALREVLNDLREAKYVSVMIVDSSNHSNLKLVQYLFW